MKDIMHWFKLRNGTYIRMKNGKAFDSKHDAEVQGMYRDAAVAQEILEMVRELRNRQYPQGKYAKSTLIRAIERRYIEDVVSWESGS